jgi:adenosylcobinamide-phosphate synthase
VPRLSPFDPALNVALATAALALEALAGYPETLFRAIGHLVTWQGLWLSACERRLNVGTPMRRRVFGVAALASLLAVSVLPAALLQSLLAPNALTLVVLVGLAACLPAQRSLHDHVLAVAEALERHGIEAGRRTVSQIVGRDPEALDEAGVARAAIESLAENFSDGVVAPAFWLAIAGLSGGVSYKAVNTADSMIGHRSERFLDFGWAAARFDDLVNLPASRLAALWIVLAAAWSSDASAAARSVLRDARRHRSPNAGWPEAAMAGALGLKLAGPRVYDSVEVEDAFMGDGRRDATASDIRAALALYRRACAIELVALAAALWIVAAVR